MAGNKEEFRLWCHEQLSCLLNFPAGFDLIDYLLTFGNAREIKEHLGSLLDIEETKSKEFINEFIKKWSQLQTNQMQHTKTSYVNPEVHNGTKKRKNQKQSQLQSSPLEDDEETNEGVTMPPTCITVDTRGAEFLDKNVLAPVEVAGKSSIPFKRKKLKFVPLYSADGKIKSDTAILPGRHACQCLAQKHKLINNCIHCGRVVCEQEGSGPCMFCGNIVCTPEENDIISRESKKSKKLMEKLLALKVPDEEEEDPKGNSGLEKAIAQKNRLLDYDKNCTKRTKVLDDEADYFSYDNDKWLTKKQKAALQKRDTELRNKRFVSRRDQKFTLDFAGRKVTETKEENYVYDAEDEVVQSVIRNLSIDQLPNKENYKENSLIDPRITILPPKFQDKGFNTDVTTFLKAQQDAVRNSLRLQDKGLQEMVDQGMCMSMHQPWASLLVSGIKKLEGRTWYSPHRGRLWIASTVKPPDQETIDQIENQYKMTYPGEVINFPQDYPSGTLLGCVNVIDCASNEEYFQQHPDNAEESQSPYLFVCDNAQELKLKFTMKGKHKIYKLEPHIHASARKCLKAS